MPHSGFVSASFTHVNNRDAYYFLRFQKLHLRVVTCFVGNKDYVATIIIDLSLANYRYDTTWCLSIKNGDGVWS